MYTTKASPRSHNPSFTKERPFSFVRTALRGKLVCLAIILNLLIWPAPGMTLRQMFEPVSSLASTVGSATDLLRSNTIELGSSLISFAASIVFVRTGPIVLPVPVRPLWPFQLGMGTARELNIADRTGRVSLIKVSPHRMVGYIEETVTFVAMGTDFRGEAVHGAKFQWESSDTNKLTIDEAGRAKLLRPGMVTVTARAGLAAQAALVLIRPIRRRLQTDSEWRADQDSLAGSTGQSSGESMLGSLMDRLAPTAHAQGNSPGDYGNATYPGAVGTPPLTALEETRLGPVMPQNNFELPIPLVSLGGRGLGTSLMAYYNSNVWGYYFDPVRNGTVNLFDPIQSWPSPGFSLGFGRIVYYNGDGVSHSFMLIDPNGTRHSLGVGTDYGTNTLQTTDGSHITYVGNAANGGMLYFNDGTAVTISKVNNRLLPTQITDTNGNYIQVAYKWETNFPGIAINFIVDTLGRVIQFNYDAYNSTNLTSISTPTGGVTLNYQNVTMNCNFPLAVAVENAPASFYGVSSIAVPQRPTYNFSYSGYGMIYSTSAASAGGTATVTYDYPLGGEDVYGGPMFTHRTESPNAVYTYTGNDVTRPDGTKLILSGADRELRSTLNATLSKTVTTLTADPGGSPAVQSVIAYDDIGQQTKIDFDYDQYGNAVNKREYGYQISGAWQVRRRTHYSYVNWEPYLGAYIRNRPTEVDVYDALQNTNDADDVLIAKSLFGYDSYGTMGGMENYGGSAAPPGHLSSYDTSKTARGNLTGVTSYSDVVSGAAVTRNSKLDVFGGVTKAQVACCNQKSFTMTEATYWSRSSQTTSGDTSGVYLTTGAGYDFNTLAAISETDPNNQTASCSYSATGDPTGFTSPTGANGSIAYNVLGEPTSSSINYSEGGVNKTLSTSAVYDGWGQMTSSVDANGAQTNYAYDIMGRRITQTNPFPQGGSPGPAASYQYDQLGRLTVTTLPGGNTIQNSYSGTVVTVTDQVNRKVKRETDGLGRLTKVTEENVSTGALTQETTYTYDAADHLIGVNQGGQTRGFKYDSEGHLLFERIPEVPALINDGTGTYWSTKYTYTSFGTMATKTDGRGVIITYGYDSLNRLTSISYNTSGAPGVLSTPNVTYTYDNNQASATKGLLLSLALGSGYSESYSYDGFKRVQSVTRTIDGHNYTTSYQFNTANQMTRITYPSGRVINFSHDSKGRLTSAGTFLTGITYNGIGQLTGSTLGNGVTESYGYDANRMQLTSQTATKSGGPTNGLMNVTYGYQASAGQMGVGSTAGNSGQLVSVSGTINGTTESAAYTFDDVGRLVTSSQTSNGSSAQRRFAYDRWGNRTGMWDAVSGGNQLQNIVIEGANHIWSVNSGNSDPNYYYDPAGNLVLAAGHGYNYDAENRMGCVDGCATGQYAYDSSNRRYKKDSGGATTHYIWEGSQVIAEYDGGKGGALIAEYVYSGNRLIAKVASGTTQYFVSDRLSERLALDTSGNVSGRQAHLPFGEDFGESGTQEKHHFTGYERDGESTTDYAVNRQYSPNVGRFMRVDPLGGNITGPQSLNRYSYAGNEPIDLFDPDGRVTLCRLVGTGSIWLSMGGDGWALVGTFSIFSCDEVGPLNNDIGRGSGGGDRKPPPKKKKDHKDVRANFKAFLNTMSDKCKTALAKYTDDLSNLADNVSLFDINDIQDQKARKWLGGKSLPKDETLGQWFDSLGHDAESVTHSPHTGIYFRGAGTFGDGASYLLLHEMMEQLVPSKKGQDLDEAVANALNIAKEDGKSWADSVSDWFNKGCSSQ